MQTKFLKVRQNFHYVIVFSKPDYNIANLIFLDTVLFVVLQVVRDFCKGQFRSVHS